MAGFQQTIIIGNVGSTNDLRYTQAGKAVHSFSVAVTERWTSDGEKREKTNWYRVTTWDKQAEVMAKHITKGMQVMVTGNVEASAYTTDSGEVRASLDLTARDVQFLGGRGEQTERQGDGAGYNGAPQENIPFDHTGDW